MLIHCSRWCKSCLWKLKAPNLFRWVWNECSTTGFGMGSFFLNITRLVLVDDHCVKTKVRLYRGEDRWQLKELYSTHDEPGDLFRDHSQLSCSNSNNVLKKHQSQHPLQKQETIIDMDRDSIFTSWVKPPPQWYIIYIIIIVNYIHKLGYETRKVCKLLFDDPKFLNMRCLKNVLFNQGKHEVWRTNPPSGELDVRSRRSGIPAASVWRFFLQPAKCDSWRRR